MRSSKWFACALTSVAIAISAIAQDSDDDSVATDDDSATPADGDADGVLDVLDKCPDRPETVNGYLDHDGCPDEPVQVSNGVANGSAVQQATNDHLETADRIDQGNLELLKWLMESDPDAYQEALAKIAEIKKRKQDEL